MAELDKYKIILEDKCGHEETVTIVGIKNALEYARTHFLRRHFSVKIEFIDPEV